MKKKLKPHTPEQSIEFRNRNTVAIAIAIIVFLVAMGIMAHRKVNAEAADPRYPFLEHVQRAQPMLSHHHARHRRRAPLDADGNPAIKKYSHLSSLIAAINYKLARYVRPTGKCSGSSEQLATYYWQGQRTATGEHFNPHGLTAASRTLPFGTQLRITNPHNGRRVLVRVNDRGPFTNAKLDLSLGAAKALGLTQSSYVCVAMR